MRVEIINCYNRKELIRSLNGIVWIKIDKELNNIMIICYMLIYCEEKYI